MELRTALELFENGGMELIKAQIKAKINNFNVLDIISNNTDLLRLRPKDKGFGVVASNLDELRDIPYLKVVFENNRIVVKFDQGATIDTWEPYMIQRFEECVFYQMLASDGKFRFNNSTTLTRSMFDHLTKLGLKGEDKGLYIIAQFN